MTVNDWSSSDSMVLQMLANTLAGQNREEKAAELLEYVLLRDADNLDALRSLCSVYLLLERHEEALKAVQRYEKSEPAIEDLMLVKGLSLWGLGKTREAVEVMNKYLAKGVNN